MANATTDIHGAAWLDAWEAARARGPGMREAALLAPACGRAEAELAALELGARDRLLLDLRCALFGEPMACTAACPACGELCEWSCDARSLRLPEGEGAHEAPRIWTHEAWTVHWRAPVGADLAVLAGSSDAHAGRRQLLSRVVLHVTHDGVERPVAALPEEVIDGLDAAMAEADPQAVLQVAIACPACGQRWEAPLDIGAFVWAEFDAWARRTVLEVHALASRYGWTEPEILALSPARRARYLSLGEP